jgi:hypothetical protein
MRKTAEYFQFIRKNGKPLSEINPGSDEQALTVSDAFKAIDLLKDSNTGILGGDIISEENNKLVYAYQLWGQEYHCLNWYCSERNSDESDADYALRSHAIAKSGIIKANETAEKLQRKCYIVLVI